MQSLDNNQLLKRKQGGEIQGIFKSGALPQFLIKTWFSL